MIKKSLFSKEFYFAISFFDSYVSPKTLLGGDSLSKTSIEKWNQIDLSYFKPHLDKAHKEGEIVLVEKDVYYQNVVLFLQRFQSLVTFWDATFVKTNFAISLSGSIPGWYTLKLSNFDYNALNNDLDVKNRVYILFYHFKIPMSVALGFFIDETYFHNDAQTQRLPA